MYFYSYHCHGVYFVRMFVCIWLVTWPDWSELKHYTYLTSWHLSHICGQCRPDRNSETVKLRHSADQFWDKMAGESALRWFTTSLTCSYKDHPLAWRGLRFMSKLDLPNSGTTSAITSRAVTITRIIAVSKLCLVCMINAVVAWLWPRSLLPGKRSGKTRTMGPHILMALWSVPAHVLGA